MSGNTGWICQRISYSTGYPKIQWADFYPEKSLMNYLILYIIYKIYDI